MIALTEQDLAQVFQVSDENPLVGLAGRLTLLHQLGHTLAAKPQRFGADCPRPGHLLDYWQTHVGTTLEADHLLVTVLTSLSDIWPGRVAIAHTNLGDVWPHPALPTTSPGSHLVPFHKLSQWLTYSLVEPLQSAGLTITNLNALTGLAEYRNGGLCIDLGLLVPKHDAVTRDAHLPSSPVVVEWRALTVVLLDLIGDRVRHLLHKTPKELPLIKVLEGGTWAAGRRIAKHRRPNSGAPPHHHPKRRHRILNAECGMQIPPTLPHSTYPPPMPTVTLIDHPLIQHKLTLMRQKDTSTAKFRQLLSEISMLLAYEVTRDMPLKKVEIETPLATMKAPMLAGKKSDADFHHAGGAGHSRRHVRADALGAGGAHRSLPRPPHPHPRRVLLQSSYRCA